MPVSTLAWPGPPRPLSLCASGVTGPLMSQAKLARPSPPSDDHRPRSFAQCSPGLSVSSQPSAPRPQPSPDPHSRCPPSPAVPAPSAAGGVPVQLHRLTQTRTELSKNWLALRPGPPLGVEAKGSRTPSACLRAVLGHRAHPSHPCSRPPGTRLRKRPPPGPDALLLLGLAVHAGPCGHFCPETGWHRAGVGPQLGHPHDTLAPNMAWGASDLHVTSGPAGD